MKDQLNEAIDTFVTYGGEAITELVTSPVQKHLQIVNEECKRLTEKKRKLFHTVVANLLYITKWARPDLEMAIELLCTRVTKK